MDVIVLENLFYSKKISQVFDLKGSERNRLVNVTQQANKQEKDLVLLDENFLICNNHNQLNSWFFFLFVFVQLRINYFMFCYYINII
jgi:hypothetical protein